MSISLEFDEIQKKKYVKFFIETTQHFTAFSYNLNVDVKMEDKFLLFRILGIGAPISPLAKSGPATFEYKMYDFENGNYTVEVIKSPKRKNTFEIFLSDDAVALRSEPTKNKFIKINIAK